MKLSVLPVPVVVMPQAIVAQSEWNTGLRAAASLARALAFAWLACLTLLVSGAGSVAWARTAPEFLDPDKAFQLSARILDARTIELRYDIAPGYYLYRERFAIEASPAETARSDAVYPAGKVKFDETFKKEVETYRDSLVIRQPFSAAPARFKLAVTSQGCADQGLCYPPRQQFLQITTQDGALREVKALSEEAGEAWVPPASAMQSLREAPATPPTAQTPDTAMGAIRSALNSGQWWSVVSVFGVAGLLLSFTPCVLPMVPILSSIIVGDRASGNPNGPAVSRWRGLSLSLAYALGMALVYTAIGVAAGLAGEGLAAALQTPLILSLFAALIALFSLSMFGAFEMQLPSAWQSALDARSRRLQGGRYVGVFFMGALSALIVGPCVAAPLASALIYISQTRDVVLGGVALFAMACGMSVPLLLLGLSAGSLLPHAGAWMNNVKRFFGVLMLGVAIWMLAPVLPTPVFMLAWGSLALLSAALLHTFEPLGPRHGSLARAGKALGIALLVLGCAQWIGALSGGRDVLQPLGHFRVAAAAERTEGSAASGAATFRPVTNSAQLDEIIATADKPVMLDFYADWCVSCIEMERFTFSDPRVSSRLAGAVLLRADVTANTPADRALLKRFGLFGPPGIVFFAPKGPETQAARLVGFENAASFLTTLDRAGL